MASPDNADGGSLGGFLLLRGGRLADSTSPADVNMGYCITRLPTPLDQVGRFTTWQSASMTEGNKDAAQQLLLRYCANELTVARRSFPDSGELVGADQFRFLVREKGLHDYKIQHYIFYRHAHFLSDFFAGLAQRRHDLVRNPDAVGGVEELTLKQLSNSAYGHSCMESRNFSSTTVVSDAHMVKKRLLDDPRVSDITLLGATLPPGLRTGGGGTGKKETLPRLMFALTRSNTDAHITNLAQLAAAVLSSSRVIFMGALSELLTNLLNPYRAELAYTGKMRHRTRHVKPDIGKKKNNPSHIHALSLQIQIRASGSRPSQLFRTVCWRGQTPNVFGVYWWIQKIPSASKGVD